MCQVLLTFSFAGVPTHYSKLIEYHDQHLQQTNVKTSMQSIRLMVSGSAPLRTPVWHKWKEITGQKIFKLQLNLQFNFHQLKQ